MVLCTCGKDIYSYGHGHLSIRSNDKFARTKSYVRAVKPYIHAYIVICPYGQTKYSHGHSRMSVRSSDIFMRTYHNFTERKRNVLGDIDVCIKV